MWCHVLLILQIILNFIDKFSLNDDIYYNNLIYFTLILIDFIDIYVIE